MLDAAVENQAIELFNVSPALFVENQGQWADESVRYVHNGSGANVAMTDTGPVFQLFRQEPANDLEANQEGLLEDLPHEQFDPDDYITDMLQFSVSFLDANSVVPIGLD